jgi:hypothetical protein
VVYQIRSPNTTGEDHPLPGSGTFQAIFRESFQTEGKPVSEEIPFSAEPRKWVHEPVCDRSGQDTSSRENRMGMICLGTGT